MARKAPNPDAPPPGGWVGPGISNLPAIAVARGSRVVRGKLVWNWVPIVAGEVPPPVRHRVRVRSQAPA